MRLLVDLIYAVVAIAALPFWARKARGGWGERFGRVEPPPEKKRPRLLIHAVSVGEVNLIRGLVERLLEETEVLVSVTTDTGHARAKGLFGGREHEGLVVRRFPLDFSRCVRRFLDAVEIDAAALVELEVWPNFIRSCERRRIPVCIVNGRLSARSFRGYRLLRSPLRRTFARLRLVCAQDDAYAERFVAMGVSPTRVKTLGSMKWDSEPRPDADLRARADRLAWSLGIDRSRPLIVAGSTAPDEHALLRDATPEGTQLLCAPRRPEWFDEAARALPGCVRRSQTDGRRPGAPPVESDLFLLDTIGELREAYLLADVAVVGRSFGSLYGSDPMEPGALGKPVVIGPSVEDFRSIVDAMLAERAIVQTDLAGLGEALRRLLEDEGERHALGERAAACVEARRGATDAHAAALRRILDEAVADRRERSRPSR